MPGTIVNSCQQKSKVSFAWFPSSFPKNLSALQHSKKPAKFKIVPLCLKLLATLLLVLVTLFTFDARPPSVPTLFTSRPFFLLLLDLNVSLKTTKYNHTSSTMGSMVLFINALLLTKR